MKWWNRLFVPFLLLAGWNTSARAGVETTGQLLMAQGPVAIRRAKLPPISCEGLEQLQTGDILTTGPQANATLVFYGNGARFALAAGSTARVERTALHPLSGPAPRKLKPLNLTFMRSVAGAAERTSPMFMGEVVRKASNTGPRDLAPNGAVRGEAALLRWNGPFQSKADGLRLRIDHVSIDARGGWIDDKTMLERDLPVATQEFMFPAELAKSGDWYLWSVAALADGHPSQRSAALIRCLSPAECASIADAEREAERARRADPGDPAPDLLMTRLYLSRGLYSEARAALLAALRLGPNKGAALEANRLEL
jgi:hypothetical protein